MISDGPTSGIPEEDVYRYIVEYARTHGGNSPSNYETARALGLASSTINFNVNKLIEAGLLERIDGHLCVVNADWRTLPVEHLPQVEEKISTGEVHALAIQAHTGEAVSFIEGRARRYGALYTGDEAGCYLLVVANGYEAQRVREFLTSYNRTP